MRKQRVDDAIQGARYHPANTLCPLVPEPLVPLTCPAEGTSGLLGEEGGARFGFPGVQDVEKEYPPCSPSSKNIKVAYVPRHCPASPVAGWQVWVYGL